MSIPKLTAEQRKNALEKAQQIRSQRMEIRKQLGAQIELTEEKMTEGFTQEEVEQFFSYVDRLSANLEKCL